MKAYAAHGVVPNDAPTGAIDHRYSFETNVLGIKIGSYTCGVVRETVAKGLWLYGGTPRDHQSFIRPLGMSTPYSPSVTEFCAKQAVLSLVASRGLRVGGNTFSTLNTILYPGDFPKMEDISQRPRLFRPLKFEFGGIDGVIISVDRERSRCHLLPLQVTIAGVRESSERLFFSQWSHWISTLALQLKNTKIEYVWITGSDSSSNRVVCQQHHQRQGINFFNPTYTRQTIALRDFSPEIYSGLRYAQSRQTPSQGKRAE